MTRPLRVLLLNERCHANPLAGGAETHLFEIFGRLACGADPGIGGVEVELLCCGFDGQAGERDEHRGVPISRVGNRFSFYTRVVGEVRRRVAAGQIDVIVEALNKIPFLTPLYTDVPTLVVHHHLHGLTAFRQVNPAIAAGAVALEQLVPLAYRRSPVITISRSSKVELVRRGLPEEHIDVVPCGIDHETHVAAPLVGREPMLLSVGRLEPYKRIDLAIRAMPAVLRDVPDARLVVAGRGQERERLERLARRLGVAERVEFPGFVTEAEKVALLQRAALLVQCSRKEGWGLTVVEAYACGTPAVAAAVPGLVDSVQDGFTGCLVQRPKPRVLAATLVKLLRDEPKRMQMAEYALGCAKRFCWDAAARDVGAALSALVPPRTPPNIEHARTTATTVDTPSWRAVG